MSFDGQVLYGERKAGITSLSSISGKTYIADLDKYIEQIGQERGYIEITSFSYYEQGTLLLSEALIGSVRVPGSLNPSAPTMMSRSISFSAL